MKLLVSIVNYGLYNQDYLKMMLREFHSMPYEIDVHLVGTHRLDLSEFTDRLTIQQVLYPSNQGWSFGFMHRQVMIDNKDNYDVFIYAENDHLITQENIEAYLKVTQRLPEQVITGFLQFEKKKADEEMYLPAARLDSEVIKTLDVEIDGHRYFTIHNLHSGCYILTRRQLAMAIASGGYHTEPHKRYKDYLVSAATDPYISCGFYWKVLPHDEIESLMVHHLPNKYVYLDGVEQDYGFMPLSHIQAQCKDFSESSDRAAS